MVIASMHMLLNISGCRKSDDRARTKARSLRGGADLLLDDDVLVALNFIHFHEPDQPAREI